MTSYLNGDWAKLHASASALLCGREYPTGGTGRDIIDCKQRFYSVVLFLAPGEPLKPQLGRFLMHGVPDGSSLEPFAVRLPGIESVWEIYLRGDPIRPPKAESEAPTKPSSPTIPDTDTDRARAAVEEFFKDVGAVRVEDASKPLQHSSVYLSTPQADPLIEGLPNFIKGIDLKGLPIMKFFDTQTKGVATAPKVQLRATVGRVPLPFRRATIKVQDAVGGGLLDDTVTGTTIYGNAPPQYVSLAVLTGIGFGSPNGAIRVKVDNGKLQANPLSRTLAMAVVEYHPIAYDPKSMKVSLGERLRAFGGIVFAPEIGASVGISIGIVRRLAASVGYATLRVDTLQPGDQVGNAPADPKDPVRTGWQKIWFAGLSIGL